MRITGLASGMDTDSLIRDMMKAKRLPLDKLTKQRQTLEWQRDDYREMNKLMLDFRLELTQYKLTSKYRARQTSSSDETKVTTTATSAASQASYTINKVDTLASAATRVNGTGGANGFKLSSTGSKFDPTKSLNSQQSNFDNGLIWESGILEKQTKLVSTDTSTLSINLVGATLKNIGDMSVKVNGKSFEVITAQPLEGLGENQVLVDSTGNLTFGSIVKKDSAVQIDYIIADKTETIPTTLAVKEFQLAKGSIDNLTLTVNGTDYSFGATLDGNTELVSGGTVIGTVNKDTGKITFLSEQPIGTTISSNYTQNYSAFSLKTFNEDGTKNVNYLITGNQSFNNVIDQVNNSDAGISMFYDSFSDQVTMTRKETGNFNNIGDGSEIISSGNFLENVLKYNLSSTESGGTNVKFDINGLSTERFSNTFEMNGVTFTIKDTFDSTTMPNGVTNTITNSTNDTFENIKSFVEKYNDLIGKIKGKTSEEYYRSYGPLTESQRESLSDKQQEQWEEKAKSGLLRRDPTLSSLLGSLRTDFYQPVDSVMNPMYRQLSSIGITTTSAYREGGKLEIDEAALKKAIEEDPESVENLFRGGGESAVDSQQGIIHRLYETIDNTYNIVREKAGGLNSTNNSFTIGKELNNVSTSISRFEKRLLMVEDRYYRQFGAMEAAIQRANQQSAYLMNAFGGGQ